MKREELELKIKKNEEKLENCVLKKENLEREIQTLKVKIENQKHALRNFKEA